MPNGHRMAATALDLTLASQAGVKMSVKIYAGLDFITTHLFVWVYCYISQKIRVMWANRAEWLGAHFTVSAWQKHKNEEVYRRLE